MAALSLDCHNNRIPTDFLPVLCRQTDEREGQVQSHLRRPGFHLRRTYRILIAQDGYYRYHYYCCYYFYYYYYCYQPPPPQPPPKPACLRPKICSNPKGRRRRPAPEFRFVRKFQSHFLILSISIRSCFSRFAPRVRSPPCVGPRAHASPCICSHFERFLFLKMWSLIEIRESDVVNSSRWRRRRNGCFRYLSMMFTRLCIILLRFCGYCFDSSFFVLVVDRYFIHVYMCSSSCQPASFEARRCSPFHCHLRSIFL